MACSATVSYMHSISYVSNKRVQFGIIITEGKLGHWDKWLEGDYDNPPKSSDDVTQGKRAPCTHVPAQVDGMCSG
jgi:hypothetical protein